jgi:hypothetical protein
MNTSHAEATELTPKPDSAVLSGANRRTLATVFAHPLAHNLQWSDVVALIGKIGAVEHKTNNEYIFTVSGAHHTMRHPHSKDMTAAELLQIRHYLEHAGWSNPHTTATPRAAPPAMPDLMVVIDHHEARIYNVDTRSDEHSMHSIKPYDPHHFQHHLAHKGQSQEPGQRTPEDIHYYEQIAQALTSAGRIILVGHGTGHSNAAAHLSDYLRTHHAAAHAQIVTELSADLSSITAPQLLELAQTTLRHARQGAQQ